MTLTFPDDRYLPDLAAFMIGEKLGEGEHRDVHVFLPDTTKVIKIDKSGTYFANVSEWTLWGEVHGTKLQRWFAPVFGISSSGLFLVQARTQPVGKLPKRLPAFFADIKRSNFGYLDGRLVAHDYAHHQVFNLGLPRKGKVEMREVEPEDHKRI